MLYSAANFRQLTSDLVALKLFHCPGFQAGVNDERIFGL